MLDRKVLPCSRRKTKERKKLARRRGWGLRVRGAPQGSLYACSGAVQVVRKLRKSEVHSLSLERRAKEESKESRRPSLRGRELNRERRASYAERRRLVGLQSSSSARLLL